MQLFYEQEAGNIEGSLHLLAESWSTGFCWVPKPLAIRRKGLLTRLKSTFFFFNINGETGFERGSNLPKFMLVLQVCGCMQSRFSPVRLLVTPWTVAWQAPLSMGVSGENTGVGCHAFLQGILPTQGSKSGV